MDLYILCTRPTDDPEDYNEVKKELNLMDDEDDSEWRPSVINCDQVCGIYPTTDHERTLIEIVTGQTYTARETFDEVREQYYSERRAIRDMFIDMLKDVISK